MTPIGAVVMSGFAALWFVGGMVLGGHGWALAGLGVVVSAGLIGAALRANRRVPKPPPEVARRVGRSVGVWSAVEGVLILVAINVLNNVGRPDLASPAIAIIVGLHFLPLAWSMRAPAYVITGLVLVALGVGTCWIRDPGLQATVLGAGAAVVLWGTSLVVLGRAGGAGATIRSG